MLVQLNLLHIKARSEIHTIVNPNQFRRRNKFTKTPTPYLAISTEKISRHDHLGLGKVFDILLLEVVAEKLCKIKFPNSNHT